MNISVPLQFVVEEQIIDDAAFITITFVFIAVSVTIALCGIVTNSINIRIFVAMGLEDGVTISFMALSITDLCFTASQVIGGIGLLFDLLEVFYDVVFPIHPFVVAGFSVNIGIILCNITGMTTIYLALARCMCVAKPLHFKNVFTRSRSIFLHISFALLAVVCYVPLLSQMGTQIKFDRKVNITRTVLWVSDIRDDVKDVTWLVVDTIFTFIVQIIVVVCIIIMTYCLVKSSQFRESMKAGDGEKMNETAFKLSGKELQVAKQVFLISVIYVTCVMPKIFIAIYSLVEPDFDMHKRLHNVYASVNFLRTTFELLNSASTFPIYFMHNSKFKHFCLQKYSFSKVSHTSHISE